MPSGEKGRQLRLHEPRTHDLDSAEINSAGTPREFLSATWVRTARFESPRQSFFLTVISTAVNRASSMVHVAFRRLAVALVVVIVACRRVSRNHSHIHRNHSAPASVFTVPATASLGRTYGTTATHIRTNYALMSAIVECLRVGAASGGHPQLLSAIEKVDLPDEDDTEGWRRLMHVRPADYSEEDEQGWQKWQDSNPNHPHPPPHLTLMPGKHGGW